MTAQQWKPELEGLPQPLAAATPTRPARVTEGRSLDPQLAVKFAALGICHSSQTVHCGLTVVLAGHAPEPVAATDDLPVRVDWLQHELGQGPGVQLVPGEVLVSKDLAADDRWPDFGKLCVSVLDLRSMVCIQIPLEAGNRALLSFYSGDPTALDHLDVDAARRLARLAAPATNSLIDEFGEELRGAPDSSSCVATALGMVVARYRVRSPEAFDLLLEASHYLDRPLLDVALEVVVEGCLPETVTRWRHRTGAGPVGAKPAPGRDAVPPWVARQPDATPPNLGNADPPVTDRIPQVGGPELWGHPEPEPEPCPGSSRAAPSPPALVPQLTGVRPASVEPDRYRAAGTTALHRLP
ncbi:MAG: ANTAR domain-containing protein [Propionibacteriaceae bacterium]|nr:ANTAR domain-containing protein [Propionibacteriaceae bacterium]